MQTLLDVAVALFFWTLTTLAILAFAANSITPYEPMHGKTSFNNSEEVLDETPSAS